MAKFTLYTLYEMYSTSRANYNTLVSDQNFTNVIVPQIKSNMVSLVLGFDNTFLGKSIINLAKTRDNTRFLNDLFRTIATGPSIIELQSKNANRAPAPNVQLVYTNIQNIWLEISNSEFAKMDPLTHSILANYGIMVQGGLKPVEGAIFTTSTPEEAERYGRTGIPAYSGVDIQIVFLTPHVQTFSGLIKVVSFSSHMNKQEVYTLGRSSPKGYTGGTRVIAGSIIANLSKNDPLMSLHPEWFDHDISSNVSFGDMFKPYLLTDQLPPFDIMVLLESETGYTSAFTIFGVTIPDHGMVMSIDDSVVEVTYQYKAKDFDIVREIALVEDPVTGRRVDPLKSAEYLLRRDMVMKGKSVHEGILSVPQKWDEMWDLLEEMAYLETLM